MFYHFIESLFWRSTPQFNTLVPHKDHTFSVPKIPQFHTKNPSVQHQNSLSSTEWTGAIEGERRVTLVSYLQMFLNSTIKFFSSQKTIYNKKIDMS